MELEMDHYEHDPVQHVVAAWAILVLLAVTALLASVI